MTRPRPSHTTHSDNAASNLHLTHEEAAILEQARKSSNEHLQIARQSPWAILGIILALLIGGSALATWITKGLDHEQAWNDRTPQIEKALNAEYTQDIQYERWSEHYGHTEILVIDGRLRTDCHVPNDAHPQIVCGLSVTLTPETPTVADPTP